MFLQALKNNFNAHTSQRETHRHTHGHKFRRNLHKVHNARTPLNFARPIFDVGTNIIYSFTGAFRSVPFTPCEFDAFRAD